MAQGAALQCSEPSVLPLSYPGTPILKTGLPINSTHVASRLIVGEGQIFGLLRYLV